METDKAVKALSALAQEHRLAAYRLLVQAGAEGLMAGVIAEQLSIAPSSLSFHLSQLRRHFFSGSSIGFLDAGCSSSPMFNRTSTHF